MTTLITRPWTQLNRKVKAAAGFGLPVMVVSIIINMMIPGMGDVLAPHVVEIGTIVGPVLSSLIAGYMTRDEA